MTQTAVLTDPRYSEHDNPHGHPEISARNEVLRDVAVAAGREGIVSLSPRAATREEITAVHAPGHFERVAETAGRDVTRFDEDTSATRRTFDVALLAAGGVLTVLDAVMAGRADNGFAIVRPPGHHAETNRAMGFCFFNNVAVGAAYLRARHGVERVAVIDWDVHHGNGTQEIFYRDPNVLFISLHQHPLYPGTGMRDERGEGAGEGATVNVPMPAGRTDADYQEAFREIVLPAARRFAPEFVLVSAGFDAHHRDPLGGMAVTETGFAAMTAMVLDLAAETAGGRLVAALEGGYDLAALRDSSLAMLGAMGGDART